MATEAQVRKLHAVRREAGMSESELLDRASEVLDHTVTDLEDLSVREASTLIDAIEDELGGTTA